MRILHCANFSFFPRPRKDVADCARTYAPDRKLSAGLIRNDHSVFDFSYRDATRFYGVLGKYGGMRKMNRALVKVAVTMQPDLLLLGHCEFVFAKTLAEIRQRIPHIKIAQWWVDWFQDRHIRHLQEKWPQLDVFFATTHPLAVQRFINLKSGDAPSLYFIPNICDLAVETECAFNYPQLHHDVFFAGRPDPSRAALIDVLDQMSGEVRVGIFGMTNDSLLGGRAFINAMGMSKIGISYNRINDIPWYVSDRIVQLAGNGCMVMTPRVPGLERFFTDKEVVYFDSTAELPDLLREFLRDDVRRIQIARAGWLRVRRSYNERRIARFIVESVFGEPYSEDYEWREEVVR